MKAKIFIKPICLILILLSFALFAEDTQTLNLKQKKKVTVLIAEQNIGNTSYSYWWGHTSTEQTDMGESENILIQVLSDNDYDVYDSSSLKNNEIFLKPPFNTPDLRNDEAKKIAITAGADIVITGKALAKLSAGISGTAMKSVQASVSLKAIRVTDGKILGTATANNAQVHINETAAGSKAISNATKTAAEELIKNIAKNSK